MAAGGSVQWEGLEAFRAGLRALPSDLADEAAGDVETATRDAARAIEQDYPTGPTGNLKRGVVVEIRRGRFNVTGIVRSRAPHASIFEAGTTTRRTAKGFNRGRMPQPPAEQRVIPEAVGVRRRLMSTLIDLVRRAGFTV